MREAWKPIIGYEGYEVSNFGRIRSRRFGGPHPVLLKRWKILKPKSCDRYPGVTLRPTPKERPVTIRIHTLVLIAFAEPCPVGFVARHLDDNPLNNRIDNLTWGTRAANTWDQEATGHRAIGSKHGMSKLTERDVAEIVRRRTAGEPRATIASEFGITSHGISDIMHGRCWMHVTGFPRYRHIKGPA